MGDGSTCHADGTSNRTPSLELQFGFCLTMALSRIGGDVDAAGVKASLEAVDGGCTGVPTVDVEPPPVRPSR